MDRICPFMSRPIPSAGSYPEVREADCLHERCAAWHQFHDPNYLDYCLLIGRHR